MTDGDGPSASDLDAIRSLCSGEVSYHVDGWRKLIHMTGLRLSVAGQWRELDAIICLNHHNATYPTKLYLTENVGCGLNWNETAYILGRNWHTFSWANVPGSLSPVEILANHLVPLTMANAA